MCLFSLLDHYRKCVNKQSLSLDKKIRKIFLLYRLQKYFLPYIQRRAMVARWIREHVLYFLIQEI